MKHLHDLPAWSKLWIHFDETKEQHMREMFEQDPERAERYWLQVGGLTLDYSKNRINDETMSLLFELAREAGVPERMQQMFHGEKNQYDRKPRRTPRCPAQPHQCPDRRGWRGCHA